MENDPLLTITDFRRVYCVRGLQKRMEAVDFDFRHFLANGAPASSMLGKGYDAMIVRVVEAKEAFENGRG